MKDRVKKLLEKNNEAFENASKKNCPVFGEILRTDEATKPQHYFLFGERYALQLILSNWEEKQNDLKNYLIELLDQRTGIHKYFIYKEVLTQIKYNYDNYMIDHDKGFLLQILELIRINNQRERDRATVEPPTEESIKMHFDEHINL